MAFIQVPADGVGKTVETNTTNGTDHRQVVTVGDKTTAANTLAINASGQITSNINGNVNVHPTDGTNPVTKMFDADTSGVTHEYVEGVSLRKAASGGSVELATASNPARIDPTGTTVQPVSGTVTANQGSANATPWNDNVAQINGVAPLMGNGVTGTGSQRVTIASDNTAFSVNATLAAETTKVIGTVNVAGSQTIAVTQATAANLKVDLSGTAANATPILVDIVPGTTNGYSIFHLISAATTNLTNVKASAGQVYGWSIYNTNAAVRYVKLHNNSGTPTAGSGVVYSIAVPPGGGSNIDCAGGITFGTGIAISTVTDVTDAGTTAVGLNDLVINIHYK